MSTNGKTLKFRAAKLKGFTVFKWKYHFTKKDHVSEIDLNFMVFTFY